MSYKSKYFSINEISCRDGCGLKPKDSILEAADAIREGWGKLHPQEPRIDCSSGARCMSYTLDLRRRKFKAALKSAHLDLEAMDLIPKNGKVKEFHDYCISRLVELDLYMESPIDAPGWLHIQTRKVAGPSRVFRA